MSNSSSDLFPPGFDQAPGPVPASRAPGGRVPAPPIEELEEIEEIEEIDEIEEISEPTPAPIAAAPKSAPAKSPPPAPAKPAAAKAEKAPAKPPAKSPPAKTPSEVDSLAELESEEEPRGFRLGAVVRNSSAMFVSMVVHLAVIVALSLVVFPEVVPPEIREVVSAMLEEPEVKEEIKIELENQLTEVTERPQIVSSASPVVGEAGASGPSASTTLESVDQSLLEQLVQADNVNVEGLFIDTPSTNKLIVEAPDGQIGEARAIVDSYQEALDHITQEILWMLDKGPVLVVWVFDQSESMKDDQKEIRSRVEHVYKQLGLVSNANKGALETAVVSYGEGYMQHTRKPTSDFYEIQTAIDEVPNDASGKEMMCSAVTQAIATHKQYAAKGGRQMALILVTDESGDRADNNANLERAVAEARSARCKTYVLGREAIFGYPFAHIRWIHPQTGHHHWIAIDRGPETAFVEQLQTDGFHRRYDAHPSGFGPYECTRLGLQTGGIFFMLPSLEQNLVHGVKRKYELEAMRPYLPDLRSRMEVKADIDASPLRTALEKVVYDLNPYEPEIAKIIVMRVEFSVDLEPLRQQITREVAKSTIYGEYLARVEKQMETLKDLRRHEASPRWQANYDLIYAQLVAYQARMYEYRAFLLEFGKNPQVVPRTKPPNLTHVHWDIRTRKELLTGPIVQPYVDRATAMFNAVITDHPGTPWAARAEHELKRGFGVHFVPEYHGPYRTLPPGTPVIPVPKM